MPEDFYKSIQREIKTASRSIKDGIYSGNNQILETVKSQLEHMLMRLQGLPSRREGIHLESTALSSKIYVQLHLAESFSPTREMNNFFQRLLKATGNSINVDKQHIDEQCLWLIYRILESKDSSTYPFKAIKLVVLQSLYWIKVGQLTKAISILESFTSKICDETKTSVKISKAHRPFKERKTKDSDWLHRLQFFLAFAYYCQDKFQEGLSALECVQSMPLIPYKQYLEACIYYKQGDLNSVIKLLSPHLEDRTVSCQLSSRQLNLMGVCLSRQCKSHTAIQMFQKSLHVDFTDVTSLYNTALQYRSLGLVEAELEALKLCIRALEEDRSSACSESSFSAVFLQCCKGRGELVSSTSHQISLPSITHQLAVRSLQLKMYEMSSEKYLDVLHYLTNGVETWNNQQLGFTVPVLEVLHQAAYALLQAGRYDDVDTVCEQVVTCYRSDRSSCFARTPQDIRNMPIPSVSNTSNITSTTTRDMEIYGLHGLAEPLNTYPSGSTNKKRARSVNADGDETKEADLIPDIQSEMISSEDLDVISLIYQADALAHLNCLHEALKNLDKAVEYLSSRVVELESEIPTPKQPQKRRRFMTGAETEADEAYDMRDLLSLAYNNKAVISIALNRHQMALHCVRLALQHSCDNLDAVYNQCLLLLKMGHVQDAIKTWFSRRSIDYHADNLYLNKLLEERKATYRCAEGNTELSQVEDTDRNRLLLDVVCLQKWISYRRIS